MDDGDAKTGLGRLPVWAWLVILTAIALGWYLWSRHKNASASPASGTAQVPETVNEVQITENPPAAPPPSPPVSPPPVHGGGKPPVSPPPRGPHPPGWRPPPGPPPHEPPPYHPPTHHPTHKKVKKAWKPSGKPVRYAAPQDMAGMASGDEEMQEA